MATLDGGNADSIINIGGGTKGRFVTRASSEAPLGAGAVTYYKKRARDSACGTPTYVTWVSTSPTAPYPGALPCGGPLVEETVVEVWTL